MNQVQLSRGKRVAPPELAGITGTTTSKNQNMKGHNAIILFINFTVVAGQFSVKLQGKSPDGEYIDVYNEAGTLMGISNATADKAVVLRGVPSDFKIVATEDTDGGTATVSYELLTM